MSVTIYAAVSGLELERAEVALAGQAYEIGVEPVPDGPDGVCLLSTVIRVAPSDADAARHRLRIAGLSPR